MVDHNPIAAQNMINLSGQMGVPFSTIEYEDRKVSHKALAIKAVGVIVIIGVGSYYMFKLAQIKNRSRKQVSSSAACSLGKEHSSLEPNKRTALSDGSNILY